MIDADLPRSPVLKFFTFLANVYLVAFGLDALVSVADEALLMAGLESPLTVLRNWLAVFVVFASIAMVFIVAFVPHLPKLLFIPLIGAALWFAVGAPPITPAVGDRAGMFALALAQMAVAAAAFLIVQLKAGRTLLSAAMLPVKSNLIVRIAFSVALMLVALAPLGLATLGALALVYATESQTQGHVRFTWTEIQSRETVMRQDAKTVRLVATAHIAERGFYERVYASIPGHAVVLAEGISDEKGLLGGDKSRRDAAEFLGLTTQDVFENLLGPAVKPGASAPAQPGKATPAPAPDNRPDVVRADVDVSELSPPTLRCLREDIAVGNAGVDDDLDAANATPQCSDADRKVSWDEILYTRNNRLLQVFDSLRSKYDVFVVPWGAMHMPDLELAFKERGFRIESRRMLTLARYETVAGHVFGGLTAFKLRGPGLRPYEISGRHR